MATTFIAASANVAAASGDLIVTPPATQTDDIMVCAVVTHDNVAVTFPAGWTIYQAGNNTTAMRATLAWKRCVGAEGAFTITHTAGDGIVANVAVYRGCITDATVINASSLLANASSSTCTATGITTTVAGCMVIFTMHDSDNGASSAQAATNPATFTERFDNASTQGLDEAVSGADAIRTTAGATGNATGTLSLGPDVNSGGLTALKPVPSIFTLTAESGAFNLVGMAANLLASFVLIAAAILFAWSGTPASLVRNYALMTESGGYAWAGTEAGLLKASAVSASPGSFVLSGMPANLSASKVFSVGGGSYLWTGTGAGLFVGRTLAAANGNYAWTGSDVDLVFTGGGTIDTRNERASSLLFALPFARVFPNPDGTIDHADRQQIGVSFCGILAGGQHVLTADSGDYSWTGSSADLLKTSVLPVNAGSYIFSGTAANLLAGRRLTAELGAYLWAGTAGGLLKSSLLSSMPGSCSWIGTAAGLLKSSVLPAGIGTFTWTGIDAELSKTAGGAFILAAGSGDYSWIGSPAELYWIRPTPSVSEYLKACWEEAFRPLIGKKPWPFRVR
jgi:hypothetical protein